MGIQNKIEEIRKKPEHIRLRYVWAMVAVSMFFIIIIWFFSLKSGQTEKAPALNGIDTTKITDQFNEGTQTLKDAGEGFQSALDQQQQQLPENSIKSIR
jgi:hypothetical protein